MTRIPSKFFELSAHLNALLDSNPAEAVKQARKIDLDTSERFNLMNLRAAILVDGGALMHQQDAIEEGLALFRELHDVFPNADITYNLANVLVAVTGNPPRDSSWLDHQDACACDLAARTRPGAADRRSGRDVGRSRSRLDLGARGGAHE